MPAGRFIGARLPRVEDPKFVRGTANYVGGIVLPGMVHLAFVRSRYAHARIRNVDVSKAKSLPGVVGVWTGQDTRDQIEPLRCIVNTNIVRNFKASDIHVVKFDKARYVGEILAVVAAESRYIAEDAVELIDVDYEELEPVFDVEKAMTKESPLLHEEWGDNIMDSAAHEIGKVDAAFAAAAVVVKQRFHTPRHQAVPMETRGCLASFDDLKRLTLWSSTQIPHVVRTEVARMLRYPDHLITVNAQDVGGGFGVKCNVFPEEPITSWVAMQLGRPVRWIEDRAESFVASYQSKEEVIDAELAVDSEGTILGVKARIICDAGAYCTAPFPSTIEPYMVIENIPGPYTIKNYKFDMYAMVTNKTPSAPYRGVGGEIAALTIDHMIHLAAKKLGKDPAELFRKNIVKREQLPYTTIAGMVLDNASYSESLEKALDIIGYDKLRNEHAELRKNGVYRGVGISTYAQGTGYGSKVMTGVFGLDISSYESAHFRMDPGGHVTVGVGTHSHGQGHETAYAQIVAERLGMPFEDVTIVTNDTSKTPFGWGTWGSRSAVTAGGALVVGCDRMVKKLERVAAALMEVSAADVEFKEGAVVVKGAPSKRMPIKEIARAVIYNRAAAMPDGEDANLELTATFDPPQLSFSNSTHVSEIEVNRETGQLKILKYVVVQDCGQIINPTLVEGQIHGAVAQGVGAVLLEDNAYDESCQPRAISFMDYLLPTAMDVPNMTVAHLETPSQIMPGGFKGMGEGGIISGPAVIINALSDALGGVAIGTYPLTPERVYQLAQMGA
ncbi:MAG TPA: xanthine dehydrogenase family protein molybdopterin-binding subunit [Candidatus Binataceae bacterium]|nr:xanthine dehydrogenase family protein molybdopterin-binding subunit [Candidatus Binataceae bacterium]